MLEEYLLELALDRTREPEAEVQALLDAESVKGVLASKGVDAVLDPSCTSPDLVLRRAPRGPSLSSTTPSCR